MTDKEEKELARLRAMAREADQLVNICTHYLNNSPLVQLLEPTLKPKPKPKPKPVLRSVSKG